MFLPCAEKSVFSNLKLGTPTPWSENTYFLAQSLKLLRLGQKYSYPDEAVALPIAGVGIDNRVYGYLTLGTATVSSR